MGMFLGVVVVIIGVTMIIAGVRGSGQQLFESFTKKTAGQAYGQPSFNVGPPGAIVPAGATNPGGTVAA